jgi:NAD(P)-dependent dehydrogenase (short-subunit alcohol dehydrogenase family)
MEGLRSEVRPFHIAVSLVEPAFFKTNFVVQAPARPLADYAPLRESVLQYVSSAVEQGPDPEQVARAILRVATTLRPRLRYRVGPREPPCRAASVAARIPVRGGVSARFSP